MSDISVSIADWTATLEVDDFGPLGAYDAVFAQELASAVIELSDDDHVKVLVLRTRRPDFAPAATPIPPPLSDVTTGWHQAFAGSTAVYQALCFSKKVVVTVVTGECSGAGSNLVLCSDLTVADQSARFASPFLDLPESNFVLASLTIRLNRAKAWLVRGTTFDAETAFSIGLVNQVVAHDELDGAVGAMTTAISGMPLDGVTMSKMLQQAVYDGHGVGREFDLVDHYAIHRWAGADATQGVQS